ncbi:hypothetical protein PP707_01885 [Acetobacter pasteurianus]|nr:hypothetical protein [Acetobacter pasteurianus]
MQTSGIPQTKSAKTHHTPHTTHSNHHTHQPPHTSHATLRLTQSIFLYYARFVNANDQWCHVHGSRLSSRHVQPIVHAI